jgi:hypothetical protein
VNLLSNAVKFTEPGGRITIGCSLASPPADSGLAPDATWLAVRVADTGIGIAAEDLTQIFEPFVQGESGHTRQRGGTGLGLTISRRLAHLMHGDITAESEPRKGSCFTLWLPAAAGSPTRTGETPAASGRRRTAAYDASTLQRVGYLLIGSITELTRRVTVRLRAEAGLPSLGAVTDAQIVDHLPTFLADLAQALLIIAEPDGDASGLLRDGNAIRGEISERHGAQRYALGWSPAQLEREHAIVAEEIERLVRARLAPDESVDSAVELLGRLVAQSRAASVRGLRRASGHAA